MAHARGIFRPDPALLRFRRRKGFHELQAIAQADLAHAHAMLGIDLLYPAHARLLPTFSVANGLLSSSCARIAAVSAPSAGTFRPSPMFFPSHSIGSAGTRNGTPSALTLLTSPPGRSTCGSSNRSSGRLIGEKQMFSASSFAESSARFQRRISS